MKAYVLTTGTVFGLLTLVHVWRATEETRLMTDPAYVLITIATAIFCVWAGRVWRQIPR
jgi:hypothetical protein